MRGPLESLHDGAYPAPPAPVAAPSLPHAIDYDGGMPGRNDHTLKAAAWRAWHAYEGLVPLRASMDALSATIARFTTVIKWIAGLMSPFAAVFVVESGRSAYGAIRDFFLSFHRN